MSLSGAPFSNAAWNLRQIARSPASWVFALLILAIHMIVTTSGGKDGMPAGGWYLEFGLSRDGFLSGKIWQLLTYGFLHGSWWHSALNAGFILLVGSRIEHMVGRLAMVRTILGGVLVGGIFHLVLSSGILVGISGGCLALLLMLTTLSPQSRMMPLPVSGRSLGLGILVAELLLALADPSLGLPGFSLLGQSILEWGMAGWFQLGHACHLGGGVAGWLLGRWVLRPRITLERLRHDRLRREAEASKRTG